MRNLLFIFFLFFSISTLFSQEDNTIIVAVKSVEKSFYDFDSVNEYCTRNPIACKELTWLHYSKIDPSNLIIEYPDISGNYVLTNNKEKYKVTIEGRKIEIDGKEALFYFDSRVQVLFIELKKEVIELEEYQGDWIGKEYTLISEFSVTEGPTTTEVPIVLESEVGLEKPIVFQSEIEKEVAELKILQPSYNTLYNRYKRTSTDKNGFSMRQIDVFLGGDGKGFKKKMTSRIIEKL